MEPGDRNTYILGRQNAFGTIFKNKSWYNKIMIDPDLKHQLDLVNQNLVEIKKKTGSSVWRSLFTGILGGLGYIIGVAIALAIIGFV